MFVTVLIYISCLLMHKFSLLQLLLFGGHGTGGWLSRYDIYYNDCVVLDRGAFYTDHLLQISFSMNLIFIIPLSLTVYYFYYGI